MKSTATKQKRLLNGHEIPYNQSTLELSKMLESKNMIDFALACEALASSKTTDNYLLLIKYLDDPDKYKRRCVWNKIFEFPDAINLVDRLAENFYSDDSMLVTMAFNVALEYNLPIRESVIWDAIDLNCKIMYSSHYALLMGLERNNINYLKIIKLYRKNWQSRSIREQIALSLEPYAVGANFDTIYTLFEKDEYSKIRYIACRIAYSNQCKELLLQFQNDSDGHIRKLAIKYLSLLERSSN